MLLRLSIQTTFTSFLLLVWTTGLWLQPSVILAAPYFEDGYLGLTQTELHQKLGMPQAVRDRKSALRVFTYYAITDWEKYFRKLVSPENGEDVYTFTRNGVEIRYSFSYTADPNDRTRESNVIRTAGRYRILPHRPSRPNPSNRPGISPVRGSSFSLVPIKYLAAVVYRHCVIRRSFHCERGVQGQTGVEVSLSALFFAGSARTSHDQSTGRSSGN